jgi:hypothetical protein
VFVKLLERKFGNPDSVVSFPLCVLIVCHQKKVETLLGPSGSFPSSTRKKESLKVLNNEIEE